MNLLIALFPALLLGQAARQANENYQTPEGRQAVARGLSAPTRDARQKPKELVRSLAIKPGQTVADIGSGTGYMLPYLSEAVGAEGKVIAEDIFDDFLEKAKASAGNAGLKNVEFVKGSEHDPNLPAESLDLILALDSYHHYNYPSEMLAAFHKALKPGGRLAIVEYYRSRTAMPGGDALRHIRADAPEVIKEVEAAGFKLLSQRDHIPGSQYVATFVRGDSL